MIGLIRDEELCLQIQEGNEAALEALVHRYHRPIFAYLYRLTGHRQTAEDLAQETFTRLMVQVHAYRFPRSFKPWIYTIAHDLYRDHVKSGAARTYPTAEPVPEQPGLVDLSERIAEQAALNQALRALEPEEREVLLLRFYQDLTSDEIAHVLAIPAGTVRSRLFRTMRKLKGLLLEPATPGERRDQHRAPQD